MDRRHKLQPHGTESCPGSRRRGRRQLQSRPHAFLSTINFDSTKNPSLFNRLNFRSPPKELLKKWMREIQFVVHLKFGTIWLESELILLQDLEEERSHPTGISSTHRLTLSCSPRCKDNHFPTASEVCGRHREKEQHGRCWQQSRIGIRCLGRAGYAKTVTGCVFSPNKAINI